MTALANVGAALSSIPAAAAQAGEAALNSAIKAVGMDGQEGGEATEKKDGEDLEEGEVAETPATAGSSAVKTVFDDPSSFNVKHPLYSTWTLYFQSPNAKNLPRLPETNSVPPGHSAGAWMDDIKKVVNFDCVEDFWGLYNNIVPPSTLPPKADYFLFRAGIIPAWEDAANKDGGKWSLQLAREKNKSQIDKMWLYTMLAAIGETFEVEAASKDTSAGAGGPDLITGLILSARPNFYRLNIWTRLAPADPNEASALVERIRTVGKHFKTAVLGYREDQKLAGGNAGFNTEVEFMSHTEAEKKGKDKIKIVI